MKWILDERCLTNLLIQMHYKDSTGFTYLTQTFLFCTCIPALHDCSGCGLKDWLLAAYKMYNFFFLIVVHYPQGVRMI